MRTGIMLATPLENQHLAWGVPFYVQQKLDGVRCRALLSRGQVTLLGSGGKEIKAVPHIESELWTIMAQMRPEQKLELDGELYKHGMPFATVSGMTNPNRTEPHPEHQKIEYHVFDIVAACPQDVRFKVLNDIFRLLTFRFIKQVETSHCQDGAMMKRMLERYVREGYEGIILRHPTALYEKKRSRNLLKCKPKHRDFYRIVGCTEERSADGTGKKTMGALICKKGEETFTVGTGFSDLVRKRVWELRKTLPAGKEMLEVEYLNLTAATGALYQPVACGIRPVDESRLAAH